MKKKKKKAAPKQQMHKKWWIAFLATHQLLFKGSLQPTAYGDLLGTCHACVPDTKKAHCCFAILGIPNYIYCKQIWNFSNERRNTQES